MNASLSIQEACIHLVETKTFEKISINDICQEAFVSRSTFYKLYKDKYDVVTTVYKKEIVEAFNELMKLLPEFDEKLDLIATEWFFQRFYNHSKLYRNLLVNSGNDWFINIFIDTCSALAKEYTKDIMQSISSQMLDYTCYFFASSLAMILKKWLSENCTIPPRELAEYYYSWFGSYWRRNFMIK